MAAALKELLLVASMELAHYLECSPYCHCHVKVKALLAAHSKEPSHASVEVQHSRRSMISIAMQSFCISRKVWSYEASFSVT